MVIFANPKIESDRVRTLWRTCLFSPRSTWILPVAPHPVGPVVWDL